MSCFNCIHNRWTPSDQRPVPLQSVRIAAVGRSCGRLSAQTADLRRFTRNVPCLARKILVHPASHGYDYRILLFLSRSAGRRRIWRRGTCAVPPAVPHSGWAPGDIRPIWPPAPPARPGPEPSGILDQESPSRPGQCGCRDPWLPGRSPGHKRKPPEYSPQWSEGAEAG